VPHYIPTHFLIGLAMLLGVGALLYIPSLATGKLGLQHQAAVRLAAKPLVFWPLLALVWASRLALVWAAGAAPFS
jgi:hypothetical protein